MEFHRDPRWTGLDSVHSFPVEDGRDRGGTGYGERGYGEVPYGGGEEDGFGGGIYGGPPAYGG